MKHMRLIVLLVALVPLCPARTVGKIIPVLHSLNSTFNQQLLNGSIQFYTAGVRKEWQLIAFNLFPVKPVTEAWIHATFSVINKKGRVQTPIYDSKADFCDFLRQPNKYHVMSLVYNEIRRFGRIPSRCPIRPSWYEFSNVSMRQIQLPSFLSETNFQAIIIGYIPGKDQYLKVQFKGALKKGSANRFKRMCNGEDRLGYKPFIQPPLRLTK